MIKMLSQFVSYINRPKTMNQAIENHDIDAVKKFIENGYFYGEGNYGYVWSKHGFGQTLKKAIKCEHLDAIRFLVNHKESHRIKDGHLYAGLLHYAARIGSINVASIFIDEFGYDVNCRHGDFGLDGFTPLHEAAWNGHLGMAKYLVSKGADVGAISSAGMCPLYLAKNTIRGKTYVELTSFLGAWI